MFVLDTHKYLAVVLILELLNGLSHLHLFLFYVVAIIGFNQSAYTFEEGDHTVEVCAAFLDPNQTSPNVVFELVGSTYPSTYPACCVNIKNTVVVPMGRAPKWSAKLGTVSSVSTFNHVRAPMSCTGQKMKFPICPMCMKSDISLTVLHKFCRG